MSCEDVGGRPTSEWLELATEATECGADVLRSARSKGRAVEWDDGRDIKIAGDSLADTEILRVLQGKSPFPILTEESGFLDSKDSTEGFRWLVDPLDGSFNYSRQIPLYCLSIALFHDDEPVLGVVNDIEHNEVFSGIVGAGAWLNGVPMHTSRVLKKDRAALCTGFPIGMTFSQEELTGLVNHMIEFKKTRLFGSAALSLAYVASGRVDAYTEKGIKLWDVAAGVALVHAAGGSVSISTNDGSYARVVTATNGRLCL